MVFCMDAALSNLFFPRFSEANLVRAVGKANVAKREKTEVKELKIDRTPMSVGVRAPFL